MKDRLLADLDARVARHADGDSSGVLEERALDVVTELVGLGEPDAGSLARVAALHLSRYQALASEQGAIDLRLALAIYTNLHTVDPRLVPADVRTVLGLASPHEAAVGLLREYEQNGQADQLERAISLLRQEVLERPADRANSLGNLGMALFHRFERFGEPGDLHEAIELSRGAVAAVGSHDARRVRYQAGLARGLLRRSELTGKLSDVDDAVAIGREVVAATEGDPQHATHLATLAGALRRRFKLAGRPGDLEEAVRLGHRAG